MKTTIAILLMSFWSTTILCQSNFEFDILKLGYASTSYYSGTSIGAEARTAIMSNLSIGIALQTQQFKPSKDLADVGFQRMSSGLLTLDLYSSKSNQYRSFIGVGFGAYHHHEDVFDFSFPSTAEDVNRVMLGVAPRVGHAFNRVRLTLDYNFTAHQFAPNYWTMSAAFTL